MDELYVISVLAVIRSERHFAWRLAGFHLPQNARALVSVRGNENGGGVNDGAHARRLTVRDVRICARAKASVLLSHSATAAKPARRSSASRAACVIQAETVMGCRAAYEVSYDNMIPSCVMRLTVSFP